MADVYVKKDGEFQKVGDADINIVRNSVNEAELMKYLKEFWTEKKGGKHSDLIKKHKAILVNDLLVSPKDLFEQLNKNTFIFQNFGPFKLNSFLKNAKLDSYLKPEYVQHTLEVTTPQPSIGKGEFLLVSCFNNINFANEAGDLTDNDGNRIEVKGNHAPIGGPKGFDQMNKGIMFSIYYLFGTSPDYNDFTMSCSKDLQEKLKDNREKISDTMKLLQNNHTKSNELAKAMTDIFNDKLNTGKKEEQEYLLLNIVAAAHLYAYLKMQNANFLFSINESRFAGFETPKTLEQSYNIIFKYFDVNGWTTGNKGITMTLKEE